MIAGHDKSRGDAHATLYCKFGKRLVDIILALISVVTFSPIMLIVSVAVFLDIGLPVIFRQDRPGLRERPFRLLKFRSMRENRDEHGIHLPDAARLTRLGRILRKTSLDELPELINVLRGDMSLVGPRPLLLQYLGRYSDEQRRRHEVRPGITGLAQVQGRNALLFSQRLAFDVEYVENCSFALDVKILVLTVVKILAFSLEDRAGQHVSVVDDVGLHPDSPAYRRRSDPPGEGGWS